MLECFEWLDQRIAVAMPLPHSGTFTADGYWLPFRKEYSERFLRIGGSDSLRELCVFELHCLISREHYRPDYPQRALRVGDDEIVTPLTFV